jgi:hypothetical protein
MHIHIEQHIMALVVTNAVEAERVDIARILQWLELNVKFQQKILTNSPDGGEHDVEGSTFVSPNLI